MIPISGHIGCIAIKGVPSNQARLQKCIPICFIKRILNGHSDCLFRIESAGIGCLDGHIVIIILVGILWIRIVRTGKGNFPGRGINIKITCIRATGDGPRENIPIRVVKSICLVPMLIEFEDPEIRNPTILTNIGLRFIVPGNGSGIPN